MQQWGGANNDDRNKGKEGERKGMDSHPTCDPRQLFSLGCAYASSQTRSALNFQFNSMIAFITRTYSVEMAEQSPGGGGRSVERLGSFPAGRV